MPASAMTLAEFFRSEGIDLFASVPTAALKITHARLAAEAGRATAAVFAAIPYAGGEGERTNLAAFARVRDYHAFARALAAGAAACVAARHPDAYAAGFADHSPYDEVHGAALAGLGVLGDNGLLITEPYSSFVFLFEFLTDLPADVLAAEGIPAGPMTLRFCEHCGRCAAACPGRCIGGGRGSCLSAITQKKGALTPEEEMALRAAPLVWGCDTCQNACPHTAAARAAGTIATRVPAFADRLGILTAADVAAMSEEEWRAYAFGWRKKEVMLRNLALKGDTAP